MMIFHNLVEVEFLKKSGLNYRKVKVGVCSHIRDKQEN
jgi:hypothetical protein